MVLLEEQELRLVDELSSMAAYVDTTTYIISNGIGIVLHISFCLCHPSINSQCIVMTCKLSELKHRLDLDCFLCIFSVQNMWPSHSKFVNYPSILLQSFVRHISLSKVPTIHLH